MRSLLAAVAILALPIAAGAQARSPQSAAPGTVFLVAVDLVNGKLKPVGSASGAVLTADGLILTSISVLGDIDKHKLHDAVAVGVLKSDGQPPDLTCLATPSKALVDEKAGLAVLRCDSDLSGKAFTPHGWANLELGKTDAMGPGSPLFIVGYPGPDDSNLHVSNGKIGGYAGADGGAGRFWMTTDVTIPAGDTGAAVVDSNGMLIGIASSAKPPSGPAGLIHPIEAAFPLLRRVVNGESADHAAPMDTQAGIEVGTAIGGAVGGVAPPINKPVAKKPASSGGGGWGARDEPSCAVATGTTIYGRVAASDNGAPIEGAFVVILKPGKHRSNVRDQYANIDEVALTYAVSDQSGNYAMPCPAPLDTKLAVIVVAKGFKELSADDVLDTTGAPERFPAWGGKILLRRAE